MSREMTHCCAELILGLSRTGVNEVVFVKRPSARWR
jgi:hypothetical protein